MSKIVLLIFLLFQYAYTTNSPSDKHLVDDLFDGLYTKEVYSGYLETDVEGTELFYIFTPSQSNPEKDPIILWLNGGPGCSSLEGFLEEIGPVIFKPYSKKPVLNEYSWNKNASVFFIESPGSVGFSTIIYKNFFFNDEIQAVSLNIAIQNFFKIFPEYQKHSFYISGESYSGTYIPYLVREMFKYMEENSDALKLNLKGVLIGNPYIYINTDFEDSMMEFGFSHALLSVETYEKYLYECPHWPQIEDIYHSFVESVNYTYDPIINENYSWPWKIVTKSCNEARNESRQQFEGINFYGIYKECPSEENTLKLKEGFQNIEYGEVNQNSRYNHFIKMANKVKNEKYLELLNNKQFLANNNHSDNESEYELAIDFFPYCGDNKYTEDFLNDNITKLKLGVNISIIHYGCNELNYKTGDSFDLYRNELKKITKEKNFSIWLFSGTEDIAVTTLGTLRFLHEINYTIINKWKQWRIDGQLAGMEQSYDYNLRFLTVKGVGHMVPEDNPKVAKFLLDKFIEYNENNKTKPEGNEDESFPVWAIIVISVAGILIILVILFIILRCRKTKKDETADESMILLKDV